MKNKSLILFLLLLSMPVVACTSTRGIIDLNTRPREAAVYLDGVKQGVTPVHFEYDFKVPARLEIVKDGYFNEDELLNKAWVIREIRKGNYTEGHYTVGGVRTKSWMISTFRRMQKKDK